MGLRLSLDLIKLGLALLGVAALAAWFLFTPPEVTEPGFDRRAVTAILVDTSASVTRARPSWRRWAVREAGEVMRGAGGRGDEVALVTFDSAAQRRAGPMEAAACLDLLRRKSKEWLLPSEVDTATDLAGAAQIAAALLGEPGRAPGRIVVLGDGVPTGADPSADLLRDPAWTLRIEEPPPQARVDLGVVRAICPRRVDPGAAVPIELDLVLVGPSIPSGSALVVDWSLQITGTDSVTRGRQLDGIGPSDSAEDRFLWNGTELNGSVEVPVPETAWASTGQGSGSRRSFRVRFKVPGQKLGTASLRATVRLDGVVADPFPENDVATAQWRIGDPVRVLVCAPPSSLKAAVSFFNGTAFDGIEFIGAAPEELGLALASVLAERPDAVVPDAVVTVELPLASLPADALTEFVETRGGGWLHSAGWPLTRADGGKLAQLAALEPDVEPKPPRDIVFLVDGSGSMEGERWMSMRTALRALVPRVPATDTLSLRFFTNTIGPEELRLEPLPVGAGGELSAAEQASRASQIARLLRLQVPGGATNIVQSLWDLARARDARGHVDQPGPDGQPVHDGLMILISDGETQSLAGRRKTTRDRIAKGRDDLVVIHVGGERGVKFLEGLLVDGEEVVLVKDLGRLVDRLREAVLDLSIVEDARLAPAALASTDSGDAWGATLEAAAERLPSAPPVAIQRAVPARPTAGAVGVANLVSESLTLTGRSSVFAAAAERGRGLVVGLAAALVAGESAKGTGDGWAPELRGRSGWLAPFFRDAARRRDDADRELDPRSEAEAATAVWVDDPANFLGADSRRLGGPILWIESLPVTGPTELMAEFYGGATLDPDGRRQGGALLARAPLEFVPSAVDPRAVRFAPVPPELLELASGTAISLEIRAAGRGEAGSTAPVASVRVVAQGPVEATSLGKGKMAAALAQLSGRGTATGSSGAAGFPDGLASHSGQNRAQRGRRGHPMVPWLLIFGLVALFVGAALQARAG